MAVAGILGGHRVIDDSIPAGKLKSAARLEVLRDCLFIRPYFLNNVTAPTDGTSTCVVTIATAASANTLSNGIVVAANETTKHKANVGLLDVNGDPLIGPNGRPLYGRVTSVAANGANWDYTITIHDTADQTTAAPAAVNWTVGLPNAIGIVELPNRKDLTQMADTEFRDRFAGLATNERDQESLNDITELFLKTGITEGVTNTYATTWYVANGDDLMTAIEKLDAAIKSVSNASDNAVLQSEMDATQTGAGLNANGTFTADGTTNYLTAATSLKDATRLLDLQVKSVQDELNTTQTGAGLSATGTYAADATTNYLTAATSLKDADKKLDTQLKAAMDEINAIETGAGLSATGTYTADGTTTYLTAATSLKDADKKLDTAIAGVQTELNTSQASVGLNTDGSYTAPAGTNYLGSATTVKAGLVALDTKVKAVQDEVDAIETGAGLGTGGTYTADGTTNYLTAATSLKGADKLLDTQVKSVADRTTTLETYKTSEGIEAGNITPTGTIDGTNRTFTLPNTPKAGSLVITAYGATLTETLHYTIAGATITYVDGYQPQPGEWHRASYRY
jgi:hypothetical protein